MIHDGNQVFVVLELLEKILALLVVIPGRAINLTAKVLHARHRGCGQCGKGEGASEDEEDKGGGGGLRLRVEQETCRGVGGVERGTWWARDRASYTRGVGWEAKSQPRACLSLWTRVKEVKSRRREGYPPVPLLEDPRHPGTLLIILSRSLFRPQNQSSRTRPPSPSFSHSTIHLMLLADSTLEVFILLAVDRRQSGE